MLKAHKASTHSRWMFPSPKIADVPLDPAAVRKRLSKILALAGCKHVRFHDLRHTFATTSLEYGMDVKTLSTIIGHNSVATTLNIYAHITDDMRAKAAASIDRGIAKQEQIISPAQKPASENMTVFTAVKGLSLIHIWSTLKSSLHSTMLFRFIMTASETTTLIA